MTKAEPVYAPIALFVYKRPEHTRDVLNSLRSCPEFDASPLFVFCDGPRRSQDEWAVEETRSVVRELAGPRATVVERDSNRGLAPSVIEGVTDLCNQYGRAIVIEDDLVVSSTFLTFMNAGLTRYEHAPDVFQIAGYMYPTQLPAQSDAVFLPFISSWGWATWSRAWRRFDPEGRGHDFIRKHRNVRRAFDLGGNYNFSAMLRSYHAREIDSWAIRWYLSVFLCSGLALFPSRSLVHNQGFGLCGTNCTSEAPPHCRAVAHCHRIERYPSEVAVDPAVFDAVKRCLGREFSLKARALGKARSVLRKTRERFAQSEAHRERRA